MPFNVGGNILTNTQVKLYNDTRIVRNGLALYLDAGIANSYPGSGTTWTDLSGNNNTGTLTNGPTYSTANGGYISFDGTNDYIAGNITNLSVYTICIMVKVLNVVVGAGIMGGSNTSYTFMQMGGGGVWQFEYAFTNYAPTVGQWAYACGVQNASSQQFLYLNGVEVANSFSWGSRISNLGTQYRIARREIGPTYSNIHVGNAQIYNRVLSAAEILQNFNALRRPYGI